MALDRADILFGKLAIGRSYVSRPDALQIAGQVVNSARTGRRESFSSAAVRLGYLQPHKVEEIQTVLAHGMLICRGTCGGQYPLNALAPEQTVACARCRGPLYVSRSGAASGEEKGSSTFLNLDSPEAAASVAAQDIMGPQAAPKQQIDVSASSTHLDENLEMDEVDGDEEEDVATNTFLDLEIDMPDAGGGGFPPPSAGVPAADGGAEGTFDIDGETTQSMDDFEGPAFEPFHIGDLEIVAPVGEGGMGCVYRAQDRSSGQTVAVKVLHRVAGDEEALLRFQREVQLATQLDHPQLVSVHSAEVVHGGELDGRPYYTMDYVQGRDLSQWAAERQRTPRESAHIVAQVCQAMEYAHSKGVVHRDLKPGNVLVTFEGDQPRVCDFGLARYNADEQNLTQAGQVIGTPNYMPPEQALGEGDKIGPHTDVYALGAICYYLWTGRPPFSGTSPFQTIEKVVREPPLPPSRLNPLVPPTLEAAVLKALSKQPADRQPTCAQLGKELAA